MTQEAQQVVTPLAALTLALEALDGVLDDAPKVLDASISGGLYEVVQCREAITAIKEALAQPEQEPVGMYRNKCADGSRCLHGCHTNESCFTSSQPQPEQEAVECDCNQGQSCHVCDPYFPFDSAPQTTRLTQKTTTNDVAIGVDVTEDGTHVTAMRMRPDGINIVIYSQFHPLAQPEQEPVVGTKTWFEDGNVVTQHLTAKDIYKEPEQEEYLSKAYRLANELRCHLAIAPAPQRTWVGLTNDEVNDFAAGCHLGNSVQGAIYKAEAKLKEKNT